MKTIKVKLFDNDEGLMPKKAHPTDAGYDLKSRIDIIIDPGDTKLVPTGVFIEIPNTDDDFLIEAQVRPRSGLARKNGITVLNTPGTIDSDYRGEIGVLIYNTSKVQFTIYKNDRIAQLVFNEIPKTTLTAVGELNETDRGSGGFGSTGVNNEQISNTSKS